ncbi:DUF4199 domain-containing protein [Galbibacter sp. EGI 63066]|uniref:DUF4199 domain-containing protein n=1 Tax=Galbibacter sp. EGI 63066 TaxID=2993559 RepID=UPI002248CBFB|nr:DUF4199 domain-containing protein [Galbibacter sp. EGI 63066]MCX2681559.1 DUF4199 domain-containing protein [Galbibacter sp. EGI 63066]
MENTQQPTTKKYALNYGLLIGGVGIIFSLMLHFMDMQYDQSAGKTIISTLILVVLVVLAIYQFKKANGGLLSLGDALKVGMGAAAIAALITVLYLLLYVNVIDPDFHEKVAEMSRAGMLKNNPEMSQEQMDQTIEMQQKFFWVTYPVVLILNIFVGFVVSLITGLIMKKSDQQL